MIMYYSLINYINILNILYKNNFIFNLRIKYICDFSDFDNYIKHDIYFNNQDYNMLLFIFSSNK
ncbi:hypothetical protein XCR1_2750022 [Xenorhabdus cabanillasii JM26]|uniref:Uncharacterized protein n=1 Tax=Xenorhabdus cabanillasii JM26 TaxID=1427517 RepID=W1J7Y2_9GAMM|nr:hypothetical protein XCR1_2750022 [Xenorhabdus cabanillasii JM26]